MSWFLIDECNKMHGAKLKIMETEVTEIRSSTG
jgi:hypothetical protein